MGIAGITCGFAFYIIYYYLCAIIELTDLKNLLIDNI